MESRNTEALEKKKENKKMDSPGASRKERSPANTLILAHVQLLTSITIRSIVLNHYICGNL